MLATEHTGWVRSLALAAGLAAILVPQPAAAADDEQTSLPIAGAAVLGIGYAQAVLVGSIFVAMEAREEAFNQGDEDGLSAADFAPLYAPVAGPFITIATAETSGVDTVLLAINGAQQTLGLGLLVTGLITMATSNSEKTTSGQATPSSAPLVIAPTVSPSATMFHVNGTF